MHKVSVGLAVLVLAAAGFGAQAADYHPPRTPGGAPDLNGTWTNISMTTIERPAGADKRVVSGAEADALQKRLATDRADPKGDDIGQRTTEFWAAAPLAKADGGLVTSWIISPADGKLPYTAEGRGRLAAARAQGVSDPEQRANTERCLASAWASMSAPMLNSPYAALYQIVQTPHEVAIISEQNHDVRIIRLGGAHAPKALHPWMGDSVGHWEKATLVVETIGFNPSESYRAPVMYISADAVVTERFTRVSATQIRYEFSVDDPAVFSQVWKAEMPFNATTDAIYEFACHEGNYGLEGILAGARQVETAQKRAGR